MNAREVDELDQLMADLTNSWRIEAWTKLDDVTAFLDELSSSLDTVPFDRSVYVPKTVFDDDDLSFSCLADDEDQDGRDSAGSIDLIAPTPLVNALPDILKHEQSVQDEAEHSSLKTPTECRSEKSTITSLTSLRSVTAKVQSNLLDEAKNQADEQFENFIQFLRTDFERSLRLLLNLTRRIFRLESIICEDEHEDLLDRKLQLWSERDEALK